MWVGYITPKGRPDFWFNGTTVRAYRFAWEELVGPIPEGMELDHVVCENPICVRPDHMEVVTPTVNRQRAINSRFVNGRPTNQHRASKTLLAVYRELVAQSPTLSSQKPLGSGSDDTST